MDVFLSILDSLSYIGCFSMFMSVLGGLAYIEESFNKKDADAYKYLEENEEFLNKNADRRNEVIRGINRRRILKKIAQIIYVLSMAAFIVEYALRFGGYV